ncbi:MAG: hypothetical protein CM15mP74_18640 [Halieaceae bacterium]|nr:MAG: hypothetical protein CM15mP74_18640 [Halieaceae bacterium]
MAPSAAESFPASKTMNRVSLEKVGMMNWGKPVGISPSTGTVLKARLATVPVMSARGPG